MSPNAPGAMHLHFPVDMKSAQALARAFQAYGKQTRMYAVRDAEDVLGISLFIYDAASFPNYIKSYYHGELCGNCGNN